MSNYFDFTADQANIFLMDIDCSDSMSGQRSSMMRGLELYRKSFEGFPEINSIAVSKCMFNESFYPGEFQHVRNFDASYATDGATALYYSIVKSSQILLDYVQEVAERKGIVPMATFIVFSDGEPCRDRAYPSDAQKAIDRLNCAGINTVFVAFGNSISAEFGKKMGFVATVDVNDRDALTEFLGVELSNSCKKQSQSMTSLGANFFSSSTQNQKPQQSLGSSFFSKANNGQSTSAGFSSATAQAFEDDSWMDEII